VSKDVRLGNSEHAFTGKFHFWEKVWQKEPHGQMEAAEGNPNSERTRN